MTTGSSGIVDSSSSAPRRSALLTFRIAQVVCDVGGMEMRRGDPDAAQVKLEEALAICRRLGTRFWIQRTEQALAEIVPE